MCGVFGFVVSDGEPGAGGLVERAVRHLGRAAESRGKDSSGLVLQRSGGASIRVFKGNLRISELIATAEVRRALRELTGNKNGTPKGTIAAMGHSRLVTNGSQLCDDNNQPVLRDGLIGIHNGIITNDAALWARHSQLIRQYAIDTEVLLALVAEYLRDGEPIDRAVTKAGREIVGTYSVAMMCQDVPRLVLISNNGSLYILSDGKRFLAFASEEAPLGKLAKRLPLELQRGATTTQVGPGGLVAVALEDLRIDIGYPGVAEVPPATGAPLEERHTPAKRGRVTAEVTRIVGRRPPQELVLDTASLARAPAALSESRLLEYKIDRVGALRRCSRCVLPETFPFITFDAQGVCNYCHGYRSKNQPKPLSELAALVDPYRRWDARPDCIVPFSGGRDSTYALHVIKKELGLNPIAFTYDWGMVTDLGRRNIARVCGALGVENIIVAADIYRKRDNIRKNVVAWLKKPHLGMVPLFMAGDKYFYYYAAKVGRETGTPLNIWGVNPLENTDFKVGFMGVAPDFEKKHIYSLSLKRQLKLFRGVGGQLLGNPGYLNRSMLDSLGSFVARSVMPHRDYFHLYDYVRWDEEEIERVLFGVYDWEKACDTETTWRIGDGTAAFYNYIYCTVAGFSEHDTFRSNQIREGQLSRERALELVERDNEPRYPTIKWYLAIIGLDFSATVGRINAIPKLY